MLIKIGFFNPKGGVGKTTILISMLEGIINNYRALGINLNKICTIDLDEYTSTLSSYVAKVKQNHTVTRLTRSNIAIYSSSISSLKGFMQGVAKMYDVMLIDYPNIQNVEGYKTLLELVDYLIVPIAMDYISNTAILSLIYFLKSLTNVKVIFVPNKHFPLTENQQASGNYQDLIEKYVSIIIEQGFTTTSHAIKLTSALIKRMQVGKFLYSLPSTRPAILDLISICFNNGKEITPGNVASSKISADILKPKINKEQETEVKVNEIKKEIE